ncbi:MAG: hypothetical protein ACLP1X_11920 [Polyangiaceae bacterium]|jgi:hypothetical protein
MENSSSFSLRESPILPPAHHSHIQALRPSVALLDGSTVRGTLATRLMSFCMLGGVAAMLTYAGDSAYMASRDSFVAPAILSPDSDVIIAGKLKLGELLLERTRVAAAIEGIDAEVAADDKGMTDLEGLRAKLDRSLRFTSEVTANRAVAGSAELDALVRQRAIISAMVSEQKKLERKALADVEAGVISRSEYAKEAQTLSQYELELVENERTTLQRDTEVRETRLTQRALTLQAESPLTPELMVREDQKIHVQLEAAHLEAEKRSKLAEKAALSGRIATLDELAAQLKSRPVYKAVDKRLDVAFVPYTQIDGVQAGARVYSCTWGLFFCKQVGTVSELVAGEILLPDPWGTPQRGQYAVLDLWDRESAKSKTLRVRSDPRTNPGPTSVAQQSVAQQ